MARTRSRVAPVVLGLTALFAALAAAAANTNEFYDTPLCDDMGTVDPVVRIVGKGERCEYDISSRHTQVYNVCRNHLMCLDGKCTEPANYGKDCTTSSDCDNSVTSVDMTCNRGKCRWKSGVGDKCNVDDDCDTNDDYADGVARCMAGVCTGSVPEGGDCSTNSCKSGLGCLSNVCVKALPPGAPCTGTDGCVSGTRCNTAAENPTCTLWASLDAGEPASATKLCKSQYREGGVCFARGAGTGKRCFDSEDLYVCKSGACGCSGGGKSHCLAKKDSSTYIDEMRAYSECMARSGCDTEGDDDWYDGWATEPYRCVHTKCKTEWIAFNCAGYDWYQTNHMAGNAELVGLMRAKYNCFHLADAAAAKAKELQALLAKKQAKRAAAWQGHVAKFHPGWAQ